MYNKYKSHLISIIIQLFIITTIMANLDDPAWVYLKRAENLKEMGNYSDAILEARKARKKFISEQLARYDEMITLTERDKIKYELTRMVEQKEEELYQSDNYPHYHELMGDLFILTDFLDEAEKEYNIALDQKSFFEYPQKEIEIKYKIANIYHFKQKFELEDIVYREIIRLYYTKKNKEFWDRIRYNISNDPSLNHVFRIYSIEGIEYLEALFKLGRRSALLQRKDEALFFLANAVIVWMSYYSQLIKKYHIDFKYSHPSDFINFISKQRLYEYGSADNIIDEILFYIGYVFYLDKKTRLMNHYFELARLFSKQSGREEDIKNRIQYLYKDTNHILTYDEIE